CSKVRPIGVEDRDALEARGNRTVRHRRKLHGLRLSAGERSAQLIGGFATDTIEAVPEGYRAPLIGDIAQHRPELALVDLPEQLPAKLKIVALLVDAPAACTGDQYAALDP